MGINYGPEHSGIAPYTTAACEHLARAGVAVKVMTGVPHYPTWTIPHEYKRALATREVVNGVVVTRLLHYVPPKQSAVRRALYEATFALHVAWRASNWRGDTVVAVVPSLLSAGAAWLVARRSGAKLVIWVQDSMSAAADQSGMSGRRLAAKVIRPIEGWILRRASSVAVISDSFREHAQSFGVQPESIATVRNWSHVSAPLSDRVEVRTQRAWVDRRVILHAGNMGLKQGLERVVEAARLAAESHPELLFVLMGDGSQRGMLEEMAAGLSNLSFIDPVPQDQFMDTLAAADFLLVCESSSVVDMSLPSKLTSYMTAGRPIVGAVRADGATARELEIAEAGRVVEGDDAEALLRTLEDLSGDPAAMDLLGGEGRSMPPRISRRLPPWPNWPTWLLPPNRFVIGRLQLVRDCLNRIDILTACIALRLTRFQISGSVRKCRWHSPGYPPNRPSPGQRPAVAVRPPSHNCSVHTLGTPVAQCLRRLIGNGSSMEGARIRRTPACARPVSA